MKKTAIVVGHTEASPGAVSPFNIAPEWEFNYAVATELCVVRGLADIFLYDTYAQGYTSMVTRNVTKINQGGYDQLFELHYNAFGDESVNGVEALYHHKSTEDWAERDIAQKFCNMMEERLGLRNRGVKHVATSKERGYAALYQPKMDAIMLEPFFGTNERDCKIIQENFMAYVDILEELITGEPASVEIDECMTFDQALKQLDKGNDVCREDSSLVLTQADIFAADWNVIK